MLPSFLNLSIKGIKSLNPLRRDSSLWRMVTWTMVFNCLRAVAALSPGNTLYKGAGQDFRGGMAVPCLRKFCAKMWSVSCKGKEQ